MCNYSLEYEVFILSLMLSCFGTVKVRDRLPRSREALSLLVGVATTVRACNPIYSTVTIRCSTSR